MIKLVVRRYYQDIEIQCISIKDAVESALNDLESGEAFPSYIEMDGRRIWELPEDYSPLGDYNIEKALGELKKG